MDAFPRDPLPPLRQIVHRAAQKYLTVRPLGLELEGDPGPVRVVVARIYALGSARTLYRERKPLCRSLDGVVSISGDKQRCGECSRRHACTPQIRLDLLIGAESYRCLLAFTSAKNYVVYQSALQREGFDVDRVDTEITVLDRGTWGELRFRRHGS